MNLSGITFAFDLDGTLVDTAPDLIGSLNMVLAEQGLPSVPVAAARSLVGRGARYLIEHGFAAAGAPLAQDDVGGLVSHFIEVYLGRIAEESRPFPGVEATLEALAGEGAKLVVCTNKLTNLSTALLDAVDLTRRFDAVIGADRAPAPKPDPRHYVAAVEAVGGEVARSLMVGDSINDVAAAQAAGAPVVVVSFGYTETPPGELGADLMIDGFDELRAAADILLSRALPGRTPSAIGSPSR